MGKRLKVAQRAGFDLASFCNLFRNLSLLVKARDEGEFRRLVDVLFLHRFFLSRTAS